MDERNRQVFLATIAHEADRDDELVEAMNAVAKIDGKLTARERSLLAIGYKKVVDARRIAWIRFSTLKEKELSMGHDQNVQMITDYMKKLEDELTTKCNEILSLIEKHLLPSSKADDTDIYCYKLKGDYFRYLAEIKEGDERDEVASQSLRAYQEATRLATFALSPTHPDKLGLFLNYAILNYEILNSRERAYNIAKLAYYGAVDELDLRGRPSYVDMSPAELADEDAITGLVQLLKNNLDLWSDIASEEGKQVDTWRTSGEVRSGSGTNATTRLRNLA